MPPKLLATLEKGLRKLKSNLEAKKTRLLDKLKKKETISDADAEWLDGEGNTVDEDRVFDLLKRAHTPERVLGEMSDGDKAVVEKLQKLAEGETKKAGEKRKRGNFNKAEEKPKTKSAQDPYEAIDGPPLKPDGPLQNPTLEDRIFVLDWLRSNKKSQSATFEHFRRVPHFRNLRFSQPSISTWVKKEKELREEYESASAHGRAAKRARQTELPEVTEMMELWVTGACNEGVHLTGDVLRTKWRQFEELAGVPEDERLKCSNGWLDAIKKRLGLKNWKRHGESGSVDPEAVERDRARIKKLISDALKEGYSLKDILNMDETGLFYAMVPDSGLSNAQHSGVKGKKVRLTYAFTVSADGSVKLRPLVIGKAKRPRAFRKKTGAQLGFLYRNNAKAWMTSEIYQQWLLDWDAELEKEGRKVILLQDNFSGHIPPSNLRNIRVVNFEPNLTSKLQPLDQGIIRCFKAHYRAAYIRRAIDRYDEGITAAKIYEIDQLEAMRLADTAWDEVDATTIKNCWKKAGILPEVQAISSEVEGVTRAERGLTDALDQLQSTGVLQPSNRMEIDLLLSPPDENPNVDHADVQEIFETVMEAKAAREALDINGGDDAEEEPLSDVPSPAEVQKAISTITSHLLASDEPYARKLEGLLSQMRRDLRLEQTRALRSTKVTDFFHRR
ncbi:hypothetical protein NMY22_g2609 [Coprinellus aureogranulatus]|nr:hypothetical protein NMY22_g2609 [Coprinellus aureogranulatus]